MLCPEGEVVPSESIVKGEETCPKKNIKISAEGTGTLDLNSFINPKTWKKSLSNFFRHQLRSTKSNDGDGPSSSNENFDEKDVAPEQKWQSLGKIFRRHSLAEHWNKSSNSQGESTDTQTKRGGVRKVLSNYFGKSPKSLSTSNEK